MQFLFKLVANKVILLSLLTIFCSLPQSKLFSQQSYNITGVVISELNGEELIGATVYLLDNKSTGSVTNIDGKYKITLPQGKYNLKCSYIGYKSQEKVIELKADSNLNFSLEPDGFTFDEIVVTSRESGLKLNDVNIGAEKLEIATLSKTPAMFGEKDIIKSIQLLPGVKSEGDGTTGFQVRGGTASQNLILLDGVPIYNAGHILGIFSTFNDEMLTNATIFKGQMPSNLGGAISAVLDLNTKNGNYDKYGLTASLGLLSARVNVEGPIIKDKMSLYFAARRSYFDLFLKTSKTYKDNILNFFDVNSKLSIDLSQQNQLFISAYLGHDNLGLKDIATMRWGNKTLSTRWFHQFSKNFYVNTTGFYTFYTSNNGMSIMENNYEMNGFIKQYGGKQEYYLKTSEQNNFSFGVQSNFIEILTADWVINNYKEKEKRRSLSNIVWLNDELTIDDKLTIQLGFRFEMYSNLGGVSYYDIDSDFQITQVYNPRFRNIFNTYFIPEPRISANYRLTENQSIKIGYNKSSQNIHALRNGSTSMPFDRYTISTNNLKPQIANQISLGYVSLFEEKKYEFSTEAYFKRTNNVLDYRDGKSYMSEIELETIVLSGLGKAYGMEFNFKKNMGALTGWISYTLSWSKNKIDGINKNQWYHAANDRRHDISIVAMCEFGNNWNIGATWQFNTGQALTAPSAKYELNGNTFYYYAERNGYRAPNYHRADISLNKTRKKKNFEDEWSFGIYNLYNRYNPFIIMFNERKVEETPQQTQAFQYSLFGILPSVSYTIRF